MKVTPELQLQFKSYVCDVAEAGRNLEFLLDNLGIEIELDYSRESLEALDNAYRSLNKDDIPRELSDESHLVWLMVQYLADMIVRSTGAKWIQVTDANPMFGQPALDGFGNKKWDRIYPVALANNFTKLRYINPNFPGVKEGKVLTAVFDKAVRLHATSALR